MFKHKLGDPTNVTLHSWIVDVEVEEGTSLDAIAEKLASALTFVEGCGYSDVEYLGQLADEPETPEIMN